MIDTMKIKCKEGLEEFGADEKFKRTEWVKQHPGQVIAAISHVIWTEEVEDTIQSDTPGAMEEYLGMLVDNLSKLTEMIRQNLTPNERRTLVALITQDVHGRDIVEQLGDENNPCYSVDDFVWQQQLRFYFDPEGHKDRGEGRGKDTIEAKQVNATLDYGYEYLGPTSRLVITPLTDRCWMTITGALNIKLGAAPAGPAGTGKTESVKDLSKGLAIQCIVFNCSD